MLILSRNTILPNLHTADNGTKHFRESRTQQVRALRAIPPRTKNFTAPRKSDPRSAPPVCHS
jgi:hypothetical protein